MAICEQIETICKDQVGDYLGKVTVHEIEQIDKALTVSIGLGGKYKMLDCVKTWAEMLKNSNSIHSPEETNENGLGDELVEQEETDSDTTQVSEESDEDDRFSEMERKLIRMEAERDVFERLYKELLRICTC